MNSTSMLLPGIAGAVIGTTVAFIFIYYILVAIATWRIFKKAGEPGWKSLIPIYNLYIMYKIVGMRTWFWLTLAISIIASIVWSLDGSLAVITYGTADELAAFDWANHIPSVVALFVTFVVGIWVSVLFNWRTSKAFGHGVGYFIGLLFLQPIFWLIIGFGSSKYHKKAIK